MNNIHTSLISETRILLADILSASTDSIEKGLSRTGNRIKGALIGFLLIGGFPAGICFFDARTDGEKLQKIKAKLIDLEAINLDKASPYYDEAMSALHFQKEIYESVESYTLTAKKIKNIAAFGFFLLSMGVNVALIAPESTMAQVSNKHLALGIGVSSGLLISIPAATYGLYHRFKGTKIDSVKQALTKKTLSL